jgi:hypothetical protein
MSYIFKFKDSDKVVNYVRTFPDVSFSFYSGSSYLNNKYNISGAFTSSIMGLPPGFVSVRELNVDRDANIDFAAAKNNFDLGVADFGDPFRQAVAFAGAGISSDPTRYYNGLNPKINSFIIKGGTQMTFQTVSTLEFDSFFNTGDAMTGSYPQSASVEKRYWGPAAPRYVLSEPPTAGPGTDTTGSVTPLMALANTLNYYQKWSPHFEVSSSLYQRDLTSSVFFGDEGPGAIDVGILEIPALLYGDSIKKGTVDLQFYVTGTLVGQLKDENQDGVLIQTGPTGSYYSGAVGGVVLYNEGFVVLTGSWNMTEDDTLYGPTHSELYGTGHDYPTWVNYAQTISASGPTDFDGHAVDQSACVLDFKGDHEIPVLTLFATAPKNKLNHSNNNTYRDYSTTLFSATGSNSYIQNKDALVKNIVSSSYNDPTGSFEKVTYISKIGIYDKQKNLLGIAKVAKPVKKLEERDLTFKLKLDI